MHLKSIIYKARLNGIPVYCIILFIIFLVAKYFNASWHTDVIPQRLHKYLNISSEYSISTTELSPREVIIVSTTVEILNKELEVFNERAFGKVKYDTTMIVVRVHRDIERLQYLIISLAQVRFIESTVVIFSHSFFDDAINKLIMKITFCRYMQIFYPFSVQLNPKQFPGIDPGDCLSQNPKPQCSKRDGRRTELKHHWWWQGHYVFNELRWSDKYTGFVIFLEEDNYVLPDLLYMLRYAKRTLSAVTDISVVVFGTPYSRDIDYDLLVVDIWRPPYDIGIAFNKSFWEEINSLASYFCTYDDLSWSRSLMKLFSLFRGGQIDMAASMTPRVFITSGYTSGWEAVQKIHSTIKQALLFPASVKAAFLYTSTGRVDTWVKPVSEGTGGWSDLRDHLLCLSPLSSVEVTTDPTVDDTTSTHTFAM